MTGLIAAIVAGVVVLLVVAIYNRLVRLRNRTDNAWAQVDVQLKRRYDLIPNLVETVKGYASHERATFEEVTKARAMAQEATGIAEQFTRTMGRWCRLLSSWMASATTSLPVPVSPSSRTVALAGATDSIWASSRLEAALSAASERGSRSALTS